MRDWERRAQEDFLKGILAIVQMFVFGVALVMLAYVTYIPQ